MISEELLDSLVGIELSDAVKVLESQNLSYSVSKLNGKFNNGNTTIVARALVRDNQILLTVTDFCLNIGARNE